VRKKMKIEHIDNRRMTNLFMYSIFIILSCWIHFSISQRA